MVADVLLCVAGKKSLYKVDRSLVLLQSAYTSLISLNNASRRSGLLGDELTGCNCVGRGKASLAERFEVLVWPAEEWLLDARADDSASEYEIPQLTADGASIDLAGDLDSTYL